MLKKIKNIVAKGEIAHFEQLLLLSQCFKKSSAARASESVYMWESVNQSVQSYEYQQKILSSIMIQFKIDFCMNQVTTRTCQ